MEQEYNTDAKIILKVVSLVIVLVAIPAAAMLIWAALNPVKDNANIISSAVGTITNDKKDIRLYGENDILMNPPQDPFTSICELAGILPDSAFKSNLYTLMGAEFSGSSAELNELLQAYAKFKIEQLKKDNTY